MRAHSLPRILMVMVLGLLWMPLAVERGVLPIHEEPLAGAFTKAPRPPLSWRSWFDGSFASGYEAWHNQNFRLRPALVRMYNQEGRWLLGVARANQIEIGRHDVLYDRESIMASRGEPVSSAEIDAFAGKLAEVERAFTAHGVTLVVGTVPGKATFWPDDVPARFGPSTHETPGSILAKALAMLGDFTINWIDIFRERQRTDPWPLFPKTGMHWSRYGSARAVEDLIAHVERRRGADLPALVWGTIKPAQTPREPDDDVGRAMNLLFPIAPGVLADAQIAVEPPAGKTRPSLLVIGDSFFWTMLEAPMTPGVFGSIDFRFYNRERHRFGEAVAVSDDIVTAALQHDVVLLIGGESLGPRLGWGFVQAAQAALAPKASSPDR